MCCGLEINILSFFLSFLSSLFSMASIVADEEVFMQFKEESKKQYTRIWSQFRDFVPEHDFELGPPAEEPFMHLTVSCRFLICCVTQVFWPVMGGGGC
jgi:hypothetical protein